MNDAPLKAWHCFDGYPDENTLLVFAETRAKARFMALSAGLWEYDSYTSISAWRAHNWDEFADRRRVISMNEELPAGAPNFYWEG